MKDKKKTNINEMTISLCPRPIFVVEMSRRFDSYLFEENLFTKGTTLLQSNPINDLNLLKIKFSRGLVFERSSLSSFSS